MSMNRDISRTNFQALAENNITMSIEEFRASWEPRLSRAFITECLADGRLKSFETPKGVRIPYSELQFFQRRLLLGNKKKKAAAKDIADING